MAEPITCIACLSAFCGAVAGPIFRACADDVFPRINECLPGFLQRLCGRNGNPSPTLPETSTSLPHESETPAVPGVGQPPGDNTNSGLPPADNTNGGRPPGEPMNGGLIINARDLEIKHSENPEYWKWIPDPRFTEVAELKYVYHLGIKATVNFRDLSLKKNYAAYLIFKTKDKPQPQGLDSTQEAYVKVGENKPPMEVCLKPTSDTADDIVQPQNWSNNWMQLELGQFFCNDAKGKAEISIMEISDGIKKTGLIVAAIEICPI